MHPVRRTVKLPQRTDGRDDETPIDPSNPLLYIRRGAGRLVRRDATSTTIAAAASARLLRGTMIATASRRGLITIAAIGLGRRRLLQKPPTEVAAVLCRKRCGIVVCQPLHHREDPVLTRLGCTHPCARSQHVSTRDQQPYAPDCHNRLRQASSNSSN